MKYRELLQEYKNGNLDEQEKIEVEKDIEKYEAISDYLFENSEIPGIDDVPEGSTDTIKVQPADTRDMVKVHPANTAEDFAKLINRRIRTAFIKAGICTALVTAAIILFVIYALPRLVDAHYYNPTETIGIDEFGQKVNRLTVDITTYSEAFMPSKYVYNANAYSRGYGKYDVTFYDGDGGYAGTIDKGNLRLFNPNELSPRINLIFRTDDSGKSVCFLSSPGGIRWIEPEGLDSLEDRSFYNASVTLDHSMRYDDFVSWCEANDIVPTWYAVSTYSNDGNPESLPLRYTGLEKNSYTTDRCVGFGTDYSMSLSCGLEKYPNLIWNEATVASDASGTSYLNYDVAKEHFLSMLTYLNDNYNSVNLFHDSIPDLWDYKQYVAKNGLYIYGFVICEDGEKLRQIDAVEDVEFVLADEKALY
ncbi:anti sigma factor C-terminal domain-containing protein [Butyrivibrio sp. WCD2001]|uniref:anti sigma factor C-terminal domain-containing protein n=1 Tax=Butyrivibrio sp. WCD2001 TaxID=1280681 RepID=UPI0003FE302D|nr:anti sigma factor C-terminal domain-containing protein [Butyrivibrio sp. WCD2001]